jgi:carboxylesterase type B
MKWDGLKETVKFAPACLQGMMMGPGNSGLALSRDCLYLNIWKKSPRDRIPVFVWIYSSGFTMGIG